MGGFDGPSATIYGDLAEKFAPGITSVRVDYRDPRKFDTSVYDTFVGVSYLASTGHKRIALVGHSFGWGCGDISCPTEPAGKGGCGSI